MNRSFGTLAWAAERGGRLTTLERGMMAVQSVFVLMASRLDRRSRTLSRDVDVSPPRGAPAQLAETLLATTTAPWLVNHGYRAFAWANALAVRDDLRPDREVLYCACLLHDLGLTEGFAPPRGECFAYHGALAARGKLGESGMDAERVERVAEAISLHLNLVVDLRKHGTEAHLLRAATALDLTGTGFRHVPASLREQLLRERPRLHIKRELAPRLDQTASLAPRTRIGFICHALHFNDFVAKAPYDE